MSAWKLAVITAAVLRECINPDVDIGRGLFRFTKDRPGVSKTIDFSVARGKPQFVLYTNGIEEAFGNRSVWASLRFAGTRDDAMMLAIAAKAARRHLCYLGLVDPFNFGDSRFFQNGEIESALGTTDQVMGRYKNRMPPDELLRRYDGTAIQMIILSLLCLDGSRIESLEQFACLVKMGHPDRTGLVFKEMFDD